MQNPKNKTKQGGFDYEDFEGFIADKCNIFFVLGFGVGHL